MPVRSVSNLRPISRFGLFSQSLFISLATLSAVARAQSPPARTGSPIPPLRPPAGSAAAAPGPGLLRILSAQGEVLLDKGGNGAETTAPLRPDAVLLSHDEISTNQGVVELGTPSGITLSLRSGGWIALLSATDLYLARGELRISQSAPSPSPDPNLKSDSASAPPPPLAPLTVATPCGRSTVKARDARLRVEGNAASVAVFDGSVVLGKVPGQVTVQSGQSVRCAKGQPIGAVRSLLAAPLWDGAGPDLFLLGDEAQASLAVVSWKPVAAAQRYRIELSSSEGESERLVRSTEVASAHPDLELRDLEVGSYVARVQAIDENGAAGAQGLPRRFFVARVTGLGPDGRVRTEPGTVPRIRAPKGMTWSALLDGAPPRIEALTPGQHRLRVRIADLSAEVTLLVSGAAPGHIAPAQRPTEPNDANRKQTDFQGDSLSVWVGGATANPDPAVPAEPEKDTKEAQTPESAAVPEPKAPRPADTEPPPAEDVLLGGIGEVPFDGVRSPWTRAYIGARVESTISGALRVGVGGRYVMRNGFGFDASTSLLRAAIANRPEGQDSPNLGNIGAAVRTPALRREHLALQGLVHVVIPLSSSFLDTSIEQEPGAGGPGSTALRPDVRPRGGGWRVEPALLFGVRARGFAISTMQGLSLRVSPELGASYSGGLLVHAGIVPMLRFITFAVWQVNYLGLNPDSGTQVPDMGGAAGWGLESLIPTRRGGSLRLALLGRVGLGEGGIALYGRGTLGFQIGYLFN